MKNNLKITSSPQFHHPQSTTSIMWTVSLCLLPAGIWGVYVFGLRALIVTLAAVIASVGTEALMGRINGKQTTFDGSAFLTGLLIGYNMPPAVPVYVVVVASIFAIAVVKWTFGGLGGNWMNPALAGRVFVFFSWTKGMTTWTLPMTHGADAVTGPTPLGSVKTGLMAISDTIHGPLDLLAAEGVPVSYMDLFLGRIPGSIGEVSALLLLLGALFLIVKKNCELGDCCFLYRKFCSSCMAFRRIPLRYRAFYWRCPFSSFFRRTDAGSPFHGYRYGYVSPDCERDEHLRTGLRFYDLPAQVFRFCSRRCFPGYYFYEHFCSPAQ